MKTIQHSEITSSGSRIKINAGKTIRVLCILFFLFDSIAKLARESHSVSGTVELGWPNKLVQVVGFILLMFTIVYAFRKTSVLGAILLTGYLGGAAATMIRVGEQFYFSLFMGILVWVGIYLTNKQLRSLIFFN